MLLLSLFAWLSNFRESALGSSLGNFCIIASDMQWSGACKIGRSRYFTSPSFSGGGYRGIQRWIGSWILQLSVVSSANFTFSNGIVVYGLPSQLGFWWWIYETYLLLTFPNLVGVLRSISDRLNDLCCFLCWWNLSDVYVIWFRTCIKLVGYRMDKIFLHLNWITVSSYYVAIAAPLGLGFGLLSSAW